MLLDYSILLKARHDELIYESITLQNIQPWWLSGLARHQIHITEKPSLYTCLFIGKTRLWFIWSTGQEPSVYIFFSLCAFHNGLVKIQCTTTHCLPNRAELNLE